VSAVSTNDLIRQIHQAPGQMVLCVTGGGSLAISDLLHRPGASRTVLEASVPYAAEALIRWLSARPDQFSSERTARAMAMVAYYRAGDYAPAEPTVPLAGLACTASLASDRPKHGAHRIHVALQTRAATLAQSVELIKGGRSREGEEAVAAALLLNLLAEFKGLEDRVETGLQPGEDLAVVRCDAPLAWQELLSGDRSLISLTEAGSSSFTGRLVFPGAFNPRHAGHREMARHAAEHLGRPVDHELSIVNVDKPPIDFIEMRRRADQFRPDELLWLSRAATFVEKSFLFPQATFIVGADTLIRIADARYYGGEHARDAALTTLAANGCRFLVFARRQDGCLQTAGSLELPQSLRQLCEEVPVERFCMDVSSSSLRERPPVGRP
jgi:nicotinamide mononucleotide (NMN) deamidase PncC